MLAPLLTGRQVAVMLGVSNKTVLRWALDGELPSIRLSNRAIRFRPEDVERWLEQRTAPGTERVTDPMRRRPAAIVSRVTDPLEH
jgi:excisionase family DNA binding protein